MVGTDRACDCHFEAPWFAACEGESERVVAFLGEQFLEETFREQGNFWIDA